MKQIFLAALLAFALVFANGTAEAGQVLIKTIEDKSVYLIEETVEVTARNPYEFTCTVIYQDTKEITYDFFTKNGETYYSYNGHGSYRLLNYPYSIESYVYAYVSENY